MASLAEQFKEVRARTIDLCRHLETEDFIVQSMPDASPAKWHLAHTTWFFEQFLLVPHVGAYRVFDESYHYLFNSYYVTAGTMHPRPERGLLARPLLRDILAYRERVEEGMLRLLESDGENGNIAQRTVLGLNHEQQHQELLLTDLKHLFSLNPALPAVRPRLPEPPSFAAPGLTFEARPGGVAEIGHDGDGFCFDNETPRHRVLLTDHELASRLVTNGEYLEFIEDGGYAEPALWLSDGWTCVQRRGWNRPLYWSEDREREFTLGGERPLDFSAPVCHVSYYEADAYARWRGCRLPTEAEWERRAASESVAGNLLDSGIWHPSAAAGGAGQWFGDTWEWTASPYAPYPGFRPLDGSLGEYNGKFMCNQLTVRGGSCVTAENHLRPSYRSFFYPDARWQFLGFRLARDGGNGT